MQYAIASHVGSNRSQVIVGLILEHLEEKNKPRDYQSNENTILCPDTFWKADIGYCYGNYLRR